MAVKQAFGFAIVCGVVFLGVDYDQQSRRSGVAVGDLSVSQYFDTISRRIDGGKRERKLAQAERDRKSRWLAGGKQFLPEAPEGWTRQPVTDHVEVFFSNSESAGNGYGEASIAATLNLESQDAAAKAQRMARRSWVYSAPDGVILVEVDLRKSVNENSMVGLVARMVGAHSTNASTRGVGVFGGVGFTEPSGWETKTDRPYRTIIGRIGFEQSVEITVKTTAPDQSVGTLLATIDFDGLNGLLSSPIPSVGNDTIVPQEAQVKLAEDMSELMGEFVQLRAGAAGQRLSSMDPNAMVANTLTQRYTGQDGVFDLTAGKQQDMQAVLELAYRDGLAKLMSDQRSADGSGGEFDAEASGNQASEFAMQAPETGTTALSDGFWAGLAGSLFGGGGATDVAEVSEPATVVVNRGLVSGGGGSCVRRAGVLSCN